jgi:hypothetical protein
MLNSHPNNNQVRIPTPIPGVPEAQARALDRRRRLHRQLRSFGPMGRLETTGPLGAHRSANINDPAGPGPA